MTTLAMATADLRDLSFVTATSVEISNEQARTGAYSYKLNAAGDRLGIFFVASSTVYFRVAFRTSYDFTFILRANTNSNYILPFIGGSALLTSSFVPQLNTWYVLEGKIVVHPTAGTVDLKINGVAIYSATNVNTGSTPANNLYLYGNSTNLYLDDIVVDDANWPGLGGLYVRPATGNGNYTAWTGDYTVVGENPPNDADFITTDSAASGTKASFTKDALPAEASIIRRVGLFARGRVNGVGGGIIAPFIRSNGVDNVPVGQAMDVSYVPIVRYWDTDPGNGNAAWAKETVDAAEIGVVSA